jgi:hypothetical protein
VTHIASSSKRTLSAEMLMPSPFDLDPARRDHVAEAAEGAGVESIVRGEGDLEREPKDASAPPRIT